MSGTEATAPVIQEPTMTSQVPEKASQEASQVEENGNGGSSPEDPGTDSAGDVDNVFPGTETGTATDASAIVDAFFQLEFHLVDSSKHPGHPKTSYACAVGKEKNAGAPIRLFEGSTYVVNNAKGFVFTTSMTSANGGKRIRTFSEEETVFTVTSTYPRHFYYHHCDYPGAGGSVHVIAH